MSRYPKGWRDGLTIEDRQLLNTKAGRAVLARINRNVGLHFAADVDRDQHVRGVALIVLRAKTKQPAPADISAENASAGAR